MFYTTLAPNLQTNCSAVTALPTALLLQRQRHSCNNNNNNNKLFAICVLATPTLTSSDPPYSAETTHDLSTSVCPLSLSLLLLLSLVLVLSHAHTHTHAHTVQKRRRFIFILFILAIWHFAFFECVREWEGERVKERVGGGERAAFAICISHYIKLFNLLMKTNWIAA